MPASDPITAAFNAVEAVVSDVAKPLINEHQAQEYDNEFQADCHLIYDNFALDDDARAPALADHISRLCIDNGYPTGGFGDDISIPISYLEALLTIAAARKRDIAKANDVTHALNTK